MIALLFLSCIIFGTAQADHTPYTPWSNPMINITNDEASIWNLKSPSYDRYNHWAQYTSMNDTHSCESCYNNGGVNCVDGAFQMSICCNHTDAYNQKMCIDQMNFCSDGMYSNEYKKLTCIMDGCKSKVYPNNDERYQYLSLYNQTKKTDMRTSNQIAEPAKNCKLVYFADKNLNGLIEFQLTTQTNVDVRVYAWPDGKIQENGVKWTGSTGRKIHVPSDWMILIQFDALIWQNTQLSTRGKVLQLTSAFNTNYQYQYSFKPTSIHFQTWVQCKNLDECQQTKYMVAPYYLKFQTNCCKMEPTSQSFCIPRNFQKSNLFSTSVYQGKTFTCPYVEPAYYNDPSEQEMSAYTILAGRATGAKSLYSTLLILLASEIFFALN